MRKVHHPKIVQWADSQWVVVCDDCARDLRMPRPIIDDPVESLQKAQLLWKLHYESVREPVRRGG